MPGVVFSLDTETEMIEGRSIPRLVLATVSNGTRHAVLRPDQLAEWVVAHLCGNQRLVCWNAKFDWAVVRQYLDREANGPSRDGLRHEAALKVWDALPAQNRLRDGMLLDFLVKLADPNTPPGVLRVRGLKDAAKEIAGIHLHKDKEVRTGFGAMPAPELWPTLPREPFDYAVADAVATLEVYRRLERRATAMVRREEVTHQAPLDLLHRHGPLTECLQVRADITLDEAGRRGLAVDPDKVQAVKGELERRIWGEVEALRGMRPDLFATYKVKARAGQLQLHKKSGLPKMKMAALRAALTEAAAEAGVDADDLPKTPKSGELACGLDTWREVAGGHPFVRSWAALADNIKLHQFTVQLDGKAEVQSDYYALVRTGRTSCRQPNVQQMPKGKWFRELFIARPGHKLVIADYAAIELVTLAAVMERRFGKSVLADVLRQGRKPHDYTAALVMGVPYEDFLALKKTDPDLHKQRRQAAKAINFGVPGGLGAERLADYARLQYGVDMGKDEAARLKHLLTTEVYPELSDYLAENVAVPLAAALGNSPRQVEIYWRAAWPDNSRFSEVGRGKTVFAGMVGVVRGLGKRNGQPYADWFIKKVWDFLCDPAVCLNPEMRKRIIAARAAGGSRELARLLFGERAVTLTGRVRAGAEYTEARNTPFQGLAADGAKVALWNLRQYRPYGWHTVAFVHDEIVVEVPERDADKALHYVPDVMKAAMRSVLTVDLPVEVEAVVADNWVK